MSALQQLALYEPTVPAPTIPMPRARAPRPVSRVCAGCREKEARYGFRDARRLENSRTLCFECFRMELDRRHHVAVRLARSWDASQAPLPLAHVLEDASLRRRRAVYQVWAQGI